MESVSVGIRVPEQIDPIVADLRLQQPRPNAGRRADALDLLPRQVAHNTGAIARLFIFGNGRHLIVSCHKPLALRLAVEIDIRIN